MQQLFNPMFWVLNNFFSYFETYSSLLLLVPFLLCWFISCFMHLLFGTGIILHSSYPLQRLQAFPGLAPTMLPLSLTFLVSALHAESSLVAHEINRKYHRANRFSNFSILAQVVSSKFYLKERRNLGFLFFFFLIDFRFFWSYFSDLIKYRNWGLFIWIFFIFFHAFPSTIPWSLASSEEPALESWWLMPYFVKLPSERHSTPKTVVS